MEVVRNPEGDLGIAVNPHLYVCVGGCDMRALGFSLIFWMQLSPFVCTGSCCNFLNGDGGRRVSLYSVLEVILTPSFIGVEVLVSPLHFLEIF